MNKKQRREMRHLRRVFRVLRLQQLATLREQDKLNYAERTIAVLIRDNFQLALEMIPPGLRWLVRWHGQRKATPLS